MDNPRNFYRTQLARGDKMCERFEDASVIQTGCSQLYKDTLRPPLERYSRAEKNPTITKIVNVSSRQLLYRWICASNHFSTVRFVFEERRHNFVCYNWPQSASVFKRSAWKSYSVISRVQSTNLHAGALFSVTKYTYTDTYRPS